jgi:single-stranded-DNA-specific exonuclease
MSLLPALQEQRWHLPAPLAPGALQAAPASDPLPEPLLALLSRRGFNSPEAIAALLDPEAAPAAGRHFPDLAKAVARLKRACSQGEAVAICGDYDADGMTSTALLVGVLQRLGARPIAAIPSRMDDGYGLNAAMVEKLAEQGVALLVTVDNGVSALEALERAKALGVEAILTDHHTIPDPLPPHLALLHPQRTPPGSPYRGLAGVGLAYVLAAALCQSLRHTDGQQIALNLFCIGTIADMAPLVGVNRRWLIDGLPELGRSPLVGLQALQQLAGLDETPLDAQAVGFQIAPRINAVGRLGDPQLVVELLTTEDPSRALALARDCEALNRQRRDLCTAIEAEALALLEADGPQRPAFLLLAQNHWHHGVIGIVAARLVERFGLPAALLAGEGNGRLRASVRAPRGFAVDGALQQCASLLERFGGHPAAGGFTVRAEQVAALHEQLNQLAQTWLQQAGHGTPVEPEALLSFEQINRSFYRQLQRLEPFGIGHPQPVFWSQGCQVATQKLLRGGHLQLELRQGEASLRAMGWRWQGETNLPALLDVAYRLRLDSWQGEERLQLELVGLRASAGGAVDGGEVVLQHHNRTYWCRREGAGLVVRNAAGDELTSAEGASHDHPYVRGLMQDAALALGLVA